MIGIISIVAAAIIPAQSTVCSFIKEYSPSDSV